MKSVLVNGVLAFVVLGIALPGLGVFITSQLFAYGALCVWVIWEIWAVVGIVRCAFRTFREPRSTLGPSWARRGFAVLGVTFSAALVYGTIMDIRMLLR